MNPLAAGKVHHGAILQVRVQFDLVGGDGLGTDRGNGLFEQRDGEIRHADLPGQAQCLGLGQCGHEFGHRNRALGGRPVDQRQVDMVGAQFAQAFAQAGNQLVGREVVGPDLGGDKQLVARHAAFGDGLADLCFVAVDLRGVDGPVAQFERGAHRINHHLAFEAESTEAQCRYAHVWSPCVERHAGRAVSNPWPL
ncbi:hypothetical protein D9M71_626540 [compost metagenome]